MKDTTNANEFTLVPNDHNSEQLVYLNNYIVEMIKRAGYRGAGLAFAKNMSDVGNKYLWRGATFARREKLQELLTVRNFFLTFSLPR